MRTVHKLFWSEKTSSKIQIRSMLFFNSFVPSKLYGLFFGLLFLAPVLRAQDTLNIAFGRISAADFNMPLPASDSDANEVILADIGKSYYEGNSSGTIGLVYTRFMRVKILNKNAFGIGSHAIPFNRSSLGIYRNGTAESITDLKGSTFNLENGIIRETKLDSASVFDEKIEREYTVRKFAMPALKEGSIYDLTYTIRSVSDDNLRSWNFQSDYPCLWSEYKVRIPESYYYRMKLQGSQKFDIISNKSVEEKFNVEYGNRRAMSMGNIKLSGKSNEFRWVKKNEPPIIKEPYVNSVQNFIDRISFQWQYFQMDERSDKVFNFSTWKDASTTFLRSKDLRETLGNDNFWLDRTVLGITGEAVDANEKMRKIYFYIRDNFTCYLHSGIVIFQNLQDVYKNKSGTAAEINMLLVAMIRHANLDAYPTVLSTRENGLANYDVPMFNEYNYMICVAENEGKEICLDASWPKNPYGRLMENCYNGGARELSLEDPKFIPLFPDSLLEKKQTNVFITTDDAGTVTGSLSTAYGYERGYKIREEIKKLSQKEYFRKELARYGGDIDIKNEGFDSLEDYDLPLTIHYDMNFRAFSNSDIVYFNPVMVFSIGANPFTSLERHFPVEMPYKTDYVYLLSMDIPKGFQVEEIPKSERIVLGENQGVFDYIIQQNPDNIQMQIRMKLNKTEFSTADYKNLREFFSHVVRKESDQIVFKKTH
jgi:transglutaminase-like putative cysteine protease